MGGQRFRTIKYEDVVLRPSFAWPAVANGLDNSHDSDFKREEVYMDDQSGHGQGLCCRLLARPLMLGSWVFMPCSCRRLGRRRWSREAVFGPLASTVLWLASWCRLRSKKGRISGTEVTQLVDLIAQHSSRERRYSTHLDQISRDALSG